MAPDDPDARDAAVFVCAKQDDTCKGVFSEFVQALEHAYNNRQFRSTPTSHEHRLPCMIIYFHPCAFTTTMKSGMIADVLLS